MLTPAEFRGVLVVNGIFSEIRYVLVLTYQISRNFKF